jgi:hypothetical protein
MKKLILAIFVLAFFEVYSFAWQAGEINLKVSADWGAIDTEEKWYAEVFNTLIPAQGKFTDTKETKIGVVISAEYLQPVIDGPIKLKMGFGAQYLLPRQTQEDFKIVPYDFTAFGQRYKADAVKYEGVKFSWIPVYFTVQVNPIPYAALFVKTNIGYNVYFNADSPDTDDKTDISVEKTNGAYWGLSTGYEFDSGLILEVGYDVYFSEAKYSWTYTGLDELHTPYIARGTYKYQYYGKFSLTAGYKFKL